MITKSALDKELLLLLLAIMSMRIFSNAINREIASNPNRIFSKAKEEEELKEEGATTKTQFANRQMQCCFRVPFSMLMTLTLPNCGVHVKKSTAKKVCSTKLCILWHLPDILDLTKRILMQAENPRQARL